MYYQGNDIYSNLLRVIYIYSRLSQKSNVNFFDINKPPWFLRYVHVESRILGLVPSEDFVVSKKNSIPGIGIKIEWFTYGIL